MIICGLVTLCQVKNQINMLLTLRADIWMEEDNIDGALESGIWAVNSLKLIECCRTIDSLLSMGICYGLCIL